MGKLKNAALNHWKPAPLPASFMLIGLLGFVISAFYVLPRSLTWAVAFIILFITMIIASLVSMIEAPAELEYQMDKRHL